MRYKVGVCTRPNENVPCTPFVVNSRYIKGLRSCRSTNRQFGVLRFLIKGIVIHSWLQILKTASDHIFSKLLIHNLLYVLSLEKAFALWIIDQAIFSPSLSLSVATIIVFAF